VKIVVFIFYFEVAGMAKFVSSRFFLGMDERDTCSVVQLQVGAM